MGRHLTTFYTRWRTDRTILQGAVLLLVEGIIMGIAIFLATVLPAWVTNTVIPLVILGVTIWCHGYYRKTFWQQIE